MSRYADSDRKEQQPPYDRHARVRFGSEGELRALIDAFEASDFGGSAFNHQRHIAVAAWYVERLGTEAALVRMRDGLHALLRALGKSDEEIAGAYHETITAFWVRLLGHLLTHDDPAEPLHRRVNTILERWGSAAPLTAHYRPETVHSERARRTWVAPDLRPLPT
jgi:hypothetical protein